MPVLIKASSSVLSAEAIEVVALSVTTKAKETGIPTPPIPPMPPTPPIPTPSTPQVSSQSPDVVVTVETEVTGTPTKAGSTETREQRRTSTTVISSEENERTQPTSATSKEEKETHKPKTTPQIMTEGGTTDVEAQLQNRCSSGKHDCSPNGTCIPLKESYKCECNLGFEGDGKKCTGKFFLSGTRHR